LVRDGHTVASIDMFGQGEFVGNGKSLATQRVLQEGKGSKPAPRPACYTFGYNSPLAIQRVHDVMSVVAFLSSDERRFKPDEIDLVAVGQQAGSVGLLARDMLANRIHRSAIDTCGFDFGKVNRLDDPMLLPGILRYGDLDALWQFASHDETVKVSGPEAAVDAIMHASNRD
jgi:hypothetical protein